MHLLRATLLRRTLRAAAGLLLAAASLAQAQGIVLAGRMGDLSLIHI